MLWKRCETQCIVKFSVERLLIDENHYFQINDKYYEIKEFKGKGESVVNEEVYFVYECSVSRQ